MLRQSRLIAFAVAVLVVVAARPSAAGINRWTTQGPSGLSVTAIAADPSGTAVYAATDGGGVLKSVDGGDHWIAAHEGMTDLRITALVLRADQPQILYAGSSDGDVFKTSNGGATWTSLARWETINAVEVDSTQHLIWIGTAHG